MHGAEKPDDGLGLVRHLPGEISAHQDAQPVSCADVLQAGRRRAQPQIDRGHALHRRRQFPREARNGQHAQRIAELGDHHRLPRLDQDRAGRRQGARQLERRQQRAWRGTPPASPAGDRIDDAVEIVIVVIVRMRVQHLSHSAPGADALGMVGGRRSSIGVSGAGMR